MFSVYSVFLRHCHCKLKQLKTIDFKQSIPLGSQTSSHFAYMQDHVVLNISILQFYRNFSKVEQNIKGVEMRVNHC